MLDLNSVKLKFLMNGERRLDNPEVLIPILDVLESSPLFMPEELAVGHFHFEEYQRRSAELSYETVTGYLNGKPCTASEFRLRRKKKIKYELRVLFGKKHRGMRLELSGWSIEKSWQPFLELCEQLAAAYRPDIAWVDYYIPVEEPFDSRVEELLFMMNFSSHIGNNYEEYGPCGLNVRTYFGPDFVERLGRHRLDSLPASVKELGWGGIVVDLTINPWQASLEDLTNTWEAAMDHLSPSKVFAIQMPSSIKNFSGSLEEMYGERGRYFQPYRDYKGYPF